MSYMSMEDLDYGLECGGYTNRYNYISGPAADDSLAFGADILTQFSFNTISTPLISLEG